MSKTAGVYAIAASTFLGMAQVQARQTPGVAAQAAQPAPPAFEVASVKSNRSGFPGGMTEMRVSGFSATNETLEHLIMAAYGVESFRIVGGPDWMRSDRFDIQARTAAETPREQLMTMLQGLLASRFRLLARKETRTLPIYELTMASGGAKPGLRPAASDACTDRGDLPAGPATGPLPSCGEMSAGPGRMKGRSVTMNLLATLLGSRVNRSVVDRTGRTEKFDLDLAWTAGDLAATTPTGIDGPPGIFTALQEQLGLKLVSSKGPVDVVVIDSVQHPRED
jgi:uncharacterized protein (TIGR03435 family)